MLKNVIKKLSAPLSVMALVLAVVCLGWLVSTGIEIPKALVTKGPLAFLATMSLVALCGVWICPEIANMLDPKDPIDASLERTFFAVLTTGLFIPWFPVYLL